MRDIAVIGGGWAGCAAAVELASRGERVTLFEASRTLGGRARGVWFDSTHLDNGQHILLGAYTETLRLMRVVGIDSSTNLLRLPLQMRYPPACGGMDFITPRLPAPLHMLAGLWRATGLQREDKFALMRFSTTARWMGWRLNTDCTVTELLQRFDQTERLTALMWRPLCIAALNTPPERASAQVFLNILRDSLGAKRSASDMLVPRVDLTTLFPASAATFIESHGGAIHCGVLIQSIKQDGHRWRLEFRGDAPVGDCFDAVVVATPPRQARSLTAAVADIPQLEAFHFEPITTCYLQYSPAIRLSNPFFALVDRPENREWGQFVFDRGWLDAKSPGLLAVVVSASTEAASLGHVPLIDAITRQLAEALHMPALSTPTWSRVVTEKRATFACTPGLSRPGNATTARGLVLAGDYTASDYPATLESAARSGVLAADAL